MAYVCFYSHESDVGDDEDMEPDTEAHHLVPLPRPDGLTTADVLGILYTPCAHTSVAPRIPRGTKNNVYVVIENTGNVARRRNGLQNVFDDDCGTYEKRNRYNKYPYLTTPNGLRRIHWDAKVMKYCRDTRSSCIQCNPLYRAAVARTQLFLFPR